jgi:potassium voltage-gated channel Shab-related subfamily B member 1
LYWGIDECYLEPCCHLKYHQKKETVIEEIRKEEEAEKINIENENFNYYHCFTIKKLLWNLFEKPQSSRAARVIAFISIFFIILSTLTLTLTTIPELQIKTLKKTFNSTTTKVNNLNDTNDGRNSRPRRDYDFETISQSNGPVKIDLKSNEELTDHPIFEYTELFCIVWFTFEYIIRFWSSPSKLKFMKAPLNIIDLISILPFFVLKLFNDPSREGHFTDARRVLTLFRVLRIMRIFKLARHSTGLQSLGYTLKKSYKELGLLMMFLSIAVLLFSSLAYFAEKEEINTKFSSIPVTFW